MYKAQSRTENVMDKQYREMVNTRRLYKFEGDFFNLPAYKYLSVQLSLTTIRNIAKLIWHEESDGRFLIPEVRFGKGLYHGTARGKKYYYSWCDRQTIELAPTQRDLMTLIHEMIHALGYDYHDSRFVERYINLLHKYGGIPKKPLIMGMKEYQVALPLKYKRLYKKCYPTAKKKK